MSNKKYYKVYGLVIESQLELDIETFKKVDNIKNDKNKVILKYGTTPMGVIEKHKIGEFVSISEKELYLYIENVATYFISNGNTVSIDICENADEAMVKLYLLGSVLGILLIQRKSLAIHGAVISNKDKTIILTGDRGAGKSTLTSAFRLKGYNYLSDDVAAISFNGNRPLIEHGFPYQKICQDMMETLDYDKSNFESFEADGKTKYLVPDFDRFITDKMELNAICQITVENVEKVTIEEITGHDKLRLVLENIYRNEYINACGGMSKEYFKQCVSVANTVRVFKITRPYNKYTVDEQVKLIEEKIFNI